MMAAPALAQFRLVGGGQQVTQVTFDNPSGPLTSRFYVLESTSGASITFTATASTTSGGNWLGVRVYSPAEGTQGTTGNSVEIRVDPSVITTSGSYNGTVLFQQLGNPTVQLSIPVTYIAGTGGGGSTTIQGFSTNPTSISLTYVPGSAAPTQNVTLSSNNGTQFTYSAFLTSGTNFVSVSSGGSGFGSFHNIGLTFNTSTLVASSTPYTGNLQITIQGQTGAINIPISVTVSGSGGGTITGYTITPTTINLNANQTSQFVSIIPANTSTPYFFSTTIINSTGNWLTVNPTSSSTVIAGTQGFTVSANSSGLQTGVTYSATVRLFVGTGQQDIPVTFTPGTTGGGSITGFSVSPTSITLSGAQTSQLVTISQTSGSSAYLFSTSVSTTNGGTWLSVNPTQSTSVVSGTQNFTVLINTASLSAGTTYTGNVRLFINGQQQDIPVSYSPSGTGGGISGFTISPTLVNLSSTQTQQAVTISPFNTGTVYSYSTTVTTTTGQQWLSVFPASSTSAIGAQSLTILANPTGLTAGFTYTGTVRVTISGQTQDITVNYTPTSTGGGGTSIPGYTINPTLINLTSTLNQQAVTITPTTATPFVFTTSVFTNSGGSWLSVVPQSSTSATASLQSFTVIANVAGLSTGTTYTGTVRVFIGSGQQDITVNVTPGGTTGGGTISGYTVTPTTVNLNSGVTQQQVQIIPSNTAVAYSYTTSVSTSIGSGWLTVSPASSTAVSGGVQSFTITANSSGLTAGFTYTGSVRVFINSQYQDIAVNFTPSSTGGGGGSIPGYTISPTVATLNASNPNQIVTISPANTSTGYSYTLTSFTSTGQGWLSTTPTASTGTVFGSQAFTILTNATGLVTGQLYTGTVRVIIGNQFQDITVNFTPGTTGGGGTGFTLSPTTINFNVNQISQLVSITPGSGTTTYSYTATPITNTGGSWLSVNPSSSSLTSGVTTFTVTANSSGLTTGVTYTGVVRVFVNSQQQDIQVSFTPGTTGGGGTGGHVSPTSLSYSYAIGQTAPAAQSFFINTPTAALFTATIQNSPVDFLRLSVYGGTTTPNLKIDAFIQPPANIPAGTHTAQVLVKVTGYADVIVTVTLTVTGSGGGGGGTVTGYNVSPTLLNFTYTPGGQLPFAQTVTLTSPSSVNYTLTLNNAISNGVQWLAAGPQTGGVTTGSPASSILTVQPTGASALPVGVYTSQILVQVGGTTVAQIPVTLTVGTVGTTTGFVAPSSLSFTHQIGTTNPTAQVLTIGTVGGSTGSYTATATTNNGGGWLSVTPISGLAPSAVSVSVNPANLTVGSYTGTVSITFSGAGTTNIPVTFQVSSSAVLKLNLTSANFNYQLGGTVPTGQAQNIEITSPGGSVGFTANATVNSGGNWLAVSPTSGATPATASIQINANGLPGGTYTGSVSFTAFGQQPVTIPVTLNVSGTPLFNTVPSGLNFVSAQQGVAPSPQTVSVTTTGASVPFTVSTTTTTGATWLSATQTVPGSISVAVNPAGLGDGTYFGAVTVAATSTGAAGNSPLVIPVTYQVGSAGGGTGGFSAQPTTMVFTQIQGGGVPPSQTLSLASSGQQFNYSLSVTTNNGGTWLSATPISGVTPGTINVSANAPSLPLGTYTGTIVATAPGAIGSPQIVNVTLNVVTAPVITANPNTLAFSSTAVGVAPAAQSVTLTSSGANLSYSASVSVGAGQPNWLEVTPTSGITPATLTVRANINGLSQGTYSGTITVNLGLSAPISIPVTFNYGAVATPQILSMTNAASFLPTAAAPGMIVAIFGSNLGPTTLQQLRLTSNGLVDTNLNGVRVLFDNIPAPMVYARNDVLSAIVPYAMAGRASANVVVEYQGVRSAPLNVRVVDASPGIFTTNQQGSGQGAILNNDFSLNGAGNPVARGQFATVYLTGEGQTAPAGVDGLISNANQLRNPIANVQVRVGDRNAQVIYAGSVPTTVLGLCQVSFFIPADAPTGNAVPLTVTIGGAASQTGVAIAVR